MSTNNIAFFALILLLFTNGTITNTQALLILALLTTTGLCANSTSCSCST